MTRREMLKMFGIAGVAAAAPALLAEPEAELVMSPVVSFGDDLDYVLIKTISTGGELTFDTGSIAFSNGPTSFGLLVKAGKVTFSQLVQIWEHRRTKTQFFVGQRREIRLSADKLIGPQCIHSELRNPPGNRERYLHVDGNVYNIGVPLQQSISWTAACGQTLGDLVIADQVEMLLTKFEPTELTYEQIHSNQGR